MGILIDCGNDLCSESYLGFILRRYAREVWNNLQEDYSNFNINNNSEALVLASNYFSAYNGVPVIRIDGNRSGAFGIIFLTKETNTRMHPEDMVRHEYGHIVQQRQIGILNYALCIFLPSWQQWDSNANYYARRCEITADLFGGVESRFHTTADIYAGYNYLQAIKDWGIFSLFSFL